MERVLSIEPSAFYASAEGGRVGYDASTGPLSISVIATTPFALFVNPVNSGKDVYVDTIEFGCSWDTIFQRLRNPAIQITGSPQPTNNRGGGEISGVGKLYVMGKFSVTGGSISKTLHLKGYSQYASMPRGAVILRPGESLAWTVLAGAGTASIYIEWWELLVPPNGN